MNTSCLLPLLAACFALSSTLLQADEWQTINVTVPKADKIAIRIPTTWKQTVIQPAPELPPTVKITSADNSLSLQLTFIPDLKERFATRENVDRVVSEASKQYLTGSVEKRITLTQLVSNFGHGCYATFTDADLADVPNPPAGQFRNVLSGLFVIKSQAVSLTLLSNSTSSPEYRQALEIISEGISTQ